MWFKTPIVSAWNPSSEATSLCLERGGIDGDGLATGVLDTSEISVAWLDGREVLGDVALEGKISSGSGDNLKTSGGSDDLNCGAEDVDGTTSTVIVSVDTYVK